MDGVEENSLIIQNLLEDQNGELRILAPHPQIQPKFGLAKTAKLTAKIIHVYCQMQQDKVMAMFKLRLVQRKKIEVKNQQVTKMNAHQK